MRKYILFLIIVAFFACSKEGPQGPVGEKGDQGVPGKDGSTVLSGKSNPDISLGKEGDFYLNLETGDLFGPKSSAGWGNSYNMKGPKGEKGERGASILTGKALPTSQIGKNGDYYIETTNLLLYGPKMDSWGEPVNLDKRSEGPGVVVYMLPADFTNNYSILPDSSFSGNTKSYLLPKAKNKVVELYWYAEPPFGIPDPLISQSWRPLFWDKKVAGANYGPQDLLLFDIVFGASITTVDSDVSLSFSIRGKGFSEKPDFSKRSSKLYFIVKVTDVKSNQVLSKNSIEVNKAGINISKKTILYK